MTTVVRSEATKLSIVAPSGSLRSLTSRVAELEDAGVAGFFAPSHLMGWIPDWLWQRSLPGVKAGPHDLPDPLIYLGALAALSRAAKLGTVVVDPFTRHPAMLAQAFLSLHRLSGGRAVVGIGAGEATNTRPYGIPFDHPASALEEALEVIKLLWSGGEVQHEGPRFTLERAVLGHTPALDPPDIWVGAHGPRMLDIAGRLADGWLPGPLPAHMYQEKWERLAAAARRSGRDPRRIRRAMMVYVVLAEDREEAEQAVLRPLARCFALPLSPDVFRAYGYDHPLRGNAMTNLIPNRVPEPEMQRALDLVPEAMLLDLIPHGGADDVLLALRPYIDRGVEEFVVFNLTPLVIPEEAAESHSRLTRLVARASTGPVGAPAVGSKGGQ